jgi:TolB-like protein
MRPLIALLLLLSAPALAEERTILVVTDFEARGATPLQAEAATGSVVRGLRNLNAFQILAADEVRQLLAIDRSRQLLTGEATDGSLNSATEALGARYMVSGTVSRPESRILVDLQLLDTKDGKVLAQKTLGPVASVETVAQELPGLAQELVGLLLEAEQGSLLVQTKEEGVEVWVDDVLRASTPMSGPVKFARGMHRVSVKKDGFIVQTRTVTLERDQVAVEAFTLVPSPDFARTYQEHHGRQRLAAWLAAGAAVAGVAGAFALDSLYSEPTWRRELQPRNLALSGADVQTVLEANLSDAQKATYVTCVENRTACYASASNASANLRTAQFATIGLGTVGLVGMATSAWFFLSSSDPNRYSGLVAGVAPTGDGASFSLSGRF